MKKKIYYKKEKNFCGLDYLTLENSPMFDHPDFGPTFVMTFKEQAKVAAPHIIKNMVQLRGKEVFVLRTALDMSLEQFARKFNLSAATVLKWERDKDKPLSLVNETVVRLFVADQLSIKLPISYSRLVSSKTPETPIVFKAA